MSAVAARSAFRVAVVGCGAVTRASLLPVLAGHERIRVVSLVDRDIDRARDLARAYGICSCLDDAAALSRDEIDGVVIATPPAHHVTAATAFARQGLHLFVEKPMATTRTDAETIVQAASDAGVALSIGLYRRLLPSVRLLRALLESEILGRPLGIDIEEGGEYSWQLAALTGLTREGAGGGVLIDLGTHLLDLLLFLAPGEARVAEYRHNARGGIETDCEARLILDTARGPLPARVELSRTRELRGSIRVDCQHGFLELHRADFTRVVISGPDKQLMDRATGASREVVVSAEWRGESSMVGYRAFRAEFDDWLQAIDGNREPQLSGRSVLPVVRLVDECYAKAQPLPEPWVDEGLDRIGNLFGTAPHIGTGRRPRVLVTGAGGFLGCRTVELLGLGGTHEVRALVRSPRSAARLARLPVEIVLGDVGSAGDMRRAMQDCDAVVHCAVGTGWPPRTAFDVTVGGTRVAATAALEAGVRRFVHISSMAVHGDRVPPRLDEASPLDPGEGFGYSRAKFLAEQAVSELAGQGLPAITLRPTRIYGPFSRTFTIRPLLALKRNALWLAGDADSPANMVYVDNVVSAILRALAAPAAEHGQAFFVSDEEQLSWRAFYGFFAEAAGATVHVSPAAETRGAGRPGWIRSWAGAVRQIGTSPELRALVKKIMWTDPIGRVPRALWDRTPWLQERALRAAGVDQAVVYRETPSEPPERVVFTIEPTTIDITKARTRLGYRPLVRSDRAMRLTSEWARHARLLPEDAPVPVETATP